VMLETINNNNMLFLSKGDTVDGIILLNVGKNFVEIEIGGKKIRITAEEVRP